MKRVIVYPPLDTRTGRWLGRVAILIPECCLHLLTEEDFQ